MKPLTKFTFPFSTATVAADHSPAAGLVAPIQAKLRANLAVEEGGGGSSYHRHLPFVQGHCDARSQIELLQCTNACHNLLFLLVELVDVTAVRYHKAVERGRKGREGGRVSGLRSKKHAKMK
jgi:hypothetical protein